MFENTLRTLRQLNGTHTYTMHIEADKDGNFDKECPNPDCMSKFKVNANDWKDKFSDETVFCPFCGYKAPAKSWWTTEQVEQAKRQAIDNVKAQINMAIKRDTEEFNRHTLKKGFITMSMKFSGSTYAVNLPAKALEEMEQHITCEKCGSRYAIIGSAFYCPCCGYNSAKQTFNNTIEKVKSKINNLEMIRQAISQYSKDEAERTCLSLIETSVPDLVVAFQRLCECIYEQQPDAKPLKRNVFQRLDDGNKLWKELIGEGYEDWITEQEYLKLRKCFQQRHLLQHKDGIVDQEYIDKSKDTTYQVGQRLVVKEKNIVEYAEIVIKLGNKIMNISDHSEEINE